MAARSRKRPPSALPVRQRIVAGARRHFLAHGFRSVTMDDVAQELGMSKKTLYANFSSKTELLEAVIRNKFEELNATLNGISPRASGDFHEVLRLLVECVQHHAHEIQPAFLRDMRRESPEIFQLVERLRSDAIQLHFGRLFDAGQRRGWVRKDIAARLMIEVLLSATQAIVNPTRLAELKLSPEDAFRAINGIILEGVLTQRGRSKR